MRLTILRPLERHGRLWLAAIAGLLALALNAGTLRSAWLSNLGYIALDARLNRSSSPSTLPAVGAPEPWFQAAQAGALQPQFEPAYGLGLADLAHGQYQAALSDFKAAIAAYPGFSGTHALLGDAYDGAGDPASAISEWQAGQALALLMARGAAQAQAGNWPAAVGWYLRATQVDPQSADAFWQLGLAYGSAGQQPAEDDALLRAVSLAPDNFQIRHALGLAYMQQGALDAAVSQFQLVLATNPDEYYTNLYLAGIELTLGHLDAAESYARKVTQLNPSDPKAHFALGSVFARRQQWAPAIAELGRAVALVAPWNRQSSLPIGRADQLTYNLLLAQTDQAAGQAGPAIAAYQAVLALDPQNAAARAALATLQPQRRP